MTTESNRCKSSFQRDRMIDPSLHSVRKTRRRLSYLVTHVGNGPENASANKNTATIMEFSQSLMVTARVEQRWHISCYCSAHEMIEHSLVNGLCIIRNINLNARTKMSSCRVLPWLGKTDPARRIIYEISCRDQRYKRRALSQAFLASVCLHSHPGMMRHIPFRSASLNQCPSMRITFTSG